MIMIQYLLDADEAVVIPGVDAPQTAFAGLAEPVALALEQEKRVSTSAPPSLRVARENGDYSRRAVHAVVHQGADRGGRQRCQTLLRVVERAGDDAAARRGVPRTRGRRRRRRHEPGMPTAAGGALCPLEVGHSASAPGAAARSARPSGSARTARAAVSRAT